MRGLLLYIMVSITSSYIFEENTLFETIQEGEFRLWQKTDCLSILYQESPYPDSAGCYFENPDAPYGLIMLPPHRDEQIDEYYGFPISDGNLSATWHLNPYEAIVLIGTIPPNCTYFGFSNYLYSRWHEPGWKPEQSYNLFNCPSGGARCEIFASLDDSINMNRGMNLMEPVFNTTFAVVFSPSMEATNAAIIELEKAGVNPMVISNYSFPGAEMKLGIQNISDTFTTLMRSAYFADSVESYIDADPYVVFRLELYDKNVTLYDRRPLIDRATNKTDGSVLNMTIDDMQNIVNKIAMNVTRRYKTKNSYVQRIQTTSNIPDNGFECIDNGVVCWGDCRDTFYPFTLDMYRREELCKHNESYCYHLMNATLTETTNDTFIVVGVNHAATNMSHYSSISIYDANYFWGIYAIGNEELIHTADEYMDDSVVSKYFYVYEFRRDCGGIPNCQSIPSSPSKNAFIPLENSIAIMERSYENPMNHVGPNPSDIILPIVIHIKEC